MGQNKNKKCSKTGFEREKKEVEKEELKSFLHFLAIQNGCKERLERKSEKSQRKELVPKDVNLKSTHCV